MNLAISRRAAHHSESGHGDLTDGSSCGVAVALAGYCRVFRGTGSDCGSLYFTFRMRWLFVSPM